MQADTIKIADIPLSGVIEINGQKFVKVRDDVGKGSQFLALKAYIPPSYCNVTPSSGTMQAWNGCAALATPTATNFTQGPCLADSRDGKVYEIRKFADGKCWMVDNLMYGGTTDACAAKTSFFGNGSSSPTGTFGAGTYGDCVDPSIACTPTGGNDCSCATAKNCGYLYNWQAAMQHASAYFNTNYTGPTTNVQGICPQGWHLPSGGKTTTTEFARLDIANGGKGTYQGSCTTASCNFWLPGFAYKGSYSGYSGSSPYAQGSSMEQWSGSAYSNTYALLLSVGHSIVRPGEANAYKSGGRAVRCIKN